MAAYILALQDLSFDAVQYAAKRVLQEETFMPVPAIMRLYAKEWESQQRQQAADRLFCLHERNEELVQMDLAAVRALIASIWPDRPATTAREPQLNLEPLEDDGIPF